MHAMVRWKSDDQQLPRTAERQKVSVYLEQERLFQEQLKDDVMEQRKLQQARLEFNLTSIGQVKPRREDVQGAK
jgi:hypothetical protein